MLTLTAEGVQRRRQTLLDQAACDLLIIANPRHIFYLTGANLQLPTLGAWGLNFLLIDRDGHTKLIVHNFVAGTLEAAHVDEQITWNWYDYSGSTGDIFAQALEVVAAHLPTNLATLRVGVEPGWDYWPNATNKVNLAPLILTMRRAKQPDELALIAECSRALDAGFQAARDTIRPGLTELDIYHAIYAAIENQVGYPVQPFNADYVSGPRSADTDGKATKRVMNAGELMICDVFPLVNGYRADCCVTLSVDKRPTARQHDLERALHEAMSTAEALLRPGTAARDVYQAVRRVTDANSALGVFPHHAGHGLGLGHPDAPYFVPNSQEVLQVGDVVTLEPGLYAAGLEGARIEHNYLITPHGYERLSQHSTAFT